MPIMDADDLPPELPPAVLEAFKRKVCITGIELDGLLGFAKSTRERMVETAKLPLRKKGQGERRDHRVYTIDDVRRLLAFMTRGENVVRLKRKRR